MPYPFSPYFKCFTRFQSFPYCTNSEKKLFEYSVSFYYFLSSKCQFRNEAYYNVNSIVCLFCFFYGNLHQKSQEHMWFDNLNTDFSNKIIIINHVPGVLFYSMTTFYLIFILEKITLPEKRYLLWRKAHVVRELFWWNVFYRAIVSLSAFKILEEVLFKVILRSTCYKRVIWDEPHAKVILDI